MTLFLVLLALQCQDCSTQCVGCTNQEVYQYPALPKMAYVPSSNLDSSEKLGGVKKKTHTHTHRHTDTHTHTDTHRHTHTHTHTRRCQAVTTVREQFSSQSPFSQRVRSTNRVSFAMLRAEKAGVFQTPQTLCEEDSLVADAAV